MSWDEARGLVKVNPFATWTDADIADYVADHGLPVHPLMTQGLPVDRLRSDHTSGRTGRRPARRPVVRHGQDRVRPPRLMAQTVTIPGVSRSVGTIGPCTSCIPTASWVS